MFVSERDTTDSGDNKTKGQDALYLIDFLSHLHPKLPFYCRTRFVSMSMNRVYAVTLPQLQNGNKGDFVVAKYTKHFALKIVPSQDQFEQEVKCITRINEHLAQQRTFFGQGVGNFTYFYALGSKKWGEALSTYQYCPELRFDNIKSDLENVVFSDRGNIVGKGSSSSNSNSRSADNSAQPWWLFQPKSEKPLPGGVIVMLCGHFGEALSDADVESVVEGVSAWLKLYHDARVLHRDIRLSNIMRFSSPSSYNPYFYYGSNSYNTSASTTVARNSLQWQLIDFNLGYCFEEEEQGDTAITHLQRGAAQCESAGVMVRGAVATETQTNPDWLQMQYHWTYSDDYQMLLRLVATLKFSAPPPGNLRLQNKVEDVDVPVPAAAATASILGKRAAASAGFVAGDEEGTGAFRSGDKAHDNDVVKLNIDDTYAFEYS
eukprot:gene30251-36557_t